jgi:hypothetical protein
MEIDWSKIAGSVVGGVVGVFAPNMAQTASKIVDKGFDIGASLIAKIKAGREASKTDAQISDSLTNLEKAELQGAINLAASQDAEFQNWINSQSTDDKNFSAMRKKAKISGLNENDPKTYAFDGTTLKLGTMKADVSKFVIFKGYPNYKTSVDVVNEIYDNSEPSEGEEQQFVENYYNEDGTAIENGQSFEQGTTEKTGTSFLWLVMLLIAGAIYYFFVYLPKQIAKKRTAKARNQKKKNEAEKQATAPKKPIVKPKAKTK